MTRTGRLVSFSTPPGAAGRLRLSVLDHDFRLEAPPDLLIHFRRMFRRFVAPDVAARDAAGRGETSVRICRAAGGNRVVIERDAGRIDLRFPDDEQTFGFLYARLLDQVTRGHANRLCVHAAALARAESGIAVAGDSGHGKSTLSLALAARGFRFLSDEVAPIRRPSATLVPFPMAVGCRPGTYELLRGTEFSEHEFEPHPFLGKTLYEPHPTGDLPPHEVPLRAVFFLDSGGRNDRPTRRYRLFMNRAVAHLAPALSAIEGVVDATADGAQTLVLEVAGGAWVAPEVERMLDGVGAMVRTVEFLDAPTPRFDRPPRLERLRASEGLLCLFRHLRGFGALEEIVAATPDGLGGLMAALAGELGQVAFYRLVPGRLAEMVDSIEGVLARPLFTRHGSRG